MTEAIAPDRALAKQAAAARALKESLRLLTDDEDAIRDSIEGETTLHEAIAAVMDGMREDEIAVAGLASMIDSLSSRKHRLLERIDRRRAALEQALQIGEIKTLRLPEATLSLKDVKPGIEITDEAKIPAKFWKAQDPTLDKKALKEALAEAKANNETIPGVTLGNGGITLQIRRS